MLMNTLCVNDPYVLISLYMLMNPLCVNDPYVLMTPMC